MQKYFIALLLFNSVLIFSQHNIEELRISYDFTQDRGGWFKVTPTVLWFEKDKVLFETLNSKVGEDPEKILAEINSDECEICNSDKPIILRGFDEYFYSDYYTQNIFYLTKREFGKNLLVKDSITIDWEITQEKDTILGYICNSATTIFRGRKYKAYYTTEIPLSIGPWKFYGLPGVILSIFTSNNEFSYIATNIFINHKENKDVLQSIKKINQEHNDPISWENYKYIANSKFFEKQKSTQSRNNNSNITYSINKPNTMETNIYFDTEDEFKEYYKDKKF